MHTIREIFQALKLIEGNASKTKKTAILTEWVNKSEEFRKIMAYAYDPARVYGIKELPDFPAIHGTIDSLSEQIPPTRMNAFEMLDALSAGTLSGDAARVNLMTVFNALSYEASEIFARILLKDMRAGFAASTLNKACPGLIPVSPYMRCTTESKSSIKEWSWGSPNEPHYAQLKADGMFVRVQVFNGNIRVYSRQGTPINGYDLGLSDAILLTLRNQTETHGELLVYDNELGAVMSREIGNGILNSIIKGGTAPGSVTIKLMVWDQIPIECSVAKGKCGIPYHARFETLKEQVEESGDPRINVIHTETVFLLEDARNVFAQALSGGHEGIIVKHRNAIWKDGTSMEQVKFKVEAECDLIVTEVLPGEKRTKNESRPGSLRCESSCGKLVVNVAVKNEKMREEIEKTQEYVLGKVMTVKYNAITKPTESNLDYSLYLPRFIDDHARDKFEPDNLDKVITDYNDALTAA